MTDKHTQQAVYNNAVWCYSVCRVHDRPGEFLDDMWINRRKSPRFYPNAVTLLPDRPDIQAVRIRELVQSRLPGQWGVKDSYCTLDLASLGFHIALEAQWLYRPAMLSRRERDSKLSDVRWVRVSDASELTRWEHAWAGADFAKLPRVFLPALLADKNVAFIAAYQDERIVAGLIANRTGEVVGVSNLFVPKEDDQLRAGCFAAAMRAFPDLPLVGYEHGQDLEQALALGFESLSPLRIWLRNNEPR